MVHSLSVWQSVRGQREYRGGRQRDLSGSRGDIRESSPRRSLKPGRVGLRPRKRTPGVTALENKRQ